MSIKIARLNQPIIKERQIPQRIPGLPLVGNLFSFGKDQVGYLTTLVHENDGIFDIKLLHRRALGLTQPHQIKHVLQDNNRNYKKVEKATARAIFGNGLVMSEGEFWLRQRRLAQPAFHRHQIADYATIL